MIKIMITGAGGQLGQEFLDIAGEFSDMDLHFYTHHDLDILDEKMLESVSKTLNPDYLINCAAYTAVDKAEQEKSLSYRINTQACESLVNVFEHTKTKIIHYSSDYVYHTCFGRVLTEDCLTDPQSVYAQTKLDGENILKNSSVPTLIIRTSWVFSSFGANFVKTMLRLSESKDEINVVYDQIGAPTYARDLAVATLQIIRETHTFPERENEFNDIYNYANEGVTSWYDLAVFIFKLSNKTTKVRAITTDQYPTLAKRPNWSMMSKEKIKKSFGLEIPHWHDALVRCLKKLE